MATLVRPWCRRPHPGCGSGVSPMVPGAGVAQDRWHDRDTGPVHGRAAPEPAATRGGPPAPAQLRGPAAQRHRPQDRRRRRWPRPAPQPRPDRRAGAARGAVLLRRRRVRAVRRRVAAGPRGGAVRGHRAHQPGHPQRPADRRRRRRGAAAGRRRLGRRRVPVAAVPGRHRGGALPGAPGPAAARRGPPGRRDVRRPGRCRPAVHRPDRTPGRPVPTRRTPARPTRARRTRARPRTARRRGCRRPSRPTSRRVASAGHACSASPWRWSRWPWAPSVSTRRAAARSPTPPTPRSRSPWSA